MGEKLRCDCLLNTIRTIALDEMFPPFPSFLCFPKSETNEHKNIDAQNVLCVWKTMANLLEFRLYLIRAENHIPGYGCPFNHMRLSHFYFPFDHFEPK